MLYILTGDIQIGKTTWLLDLVSKCAESTRFYGVVAPGAWRREESGGLEKTGIENVLLPSGERVLFAKKRSHFEFDGLASADGSIRGKMGWEFSDEALDRVNAYFSQLAERAVPLETSDGSMVSDPARSNERKTRCMKVSDFAPGDGLLIVDELGQLELLAGEGLTEAARLLQLGPTNCWSDALVVVRDRADLRTAAEKLLMEHWGEVVYLTL